MRTLLLLTLFAGSLRADDAAVAIITKALKATGWDTRDTGNATWKDKGKMTVAGQSMTYSGDFHISYPDKLRFDMAIKVADNDFNLSVIVNGDQAWETSAGRVQWVAGDKLTYLRNEVYAMTVFSLRPLVDPKGEYKLTAAGEATIADKKCLGVTVSKQDKPDIKLWFDAASGLPVKLEYKVKNEQDEWKEATDEMFVSDWSDGTVKSFGKMRVDRNGKTMIESTLSDYKEPEKVDPKLYSKP